MRVAQLFMVRMYWSILVSVIWCQY